jgi:hypothetical protein
MDYSRLRRINIWGRRVVENDITLFRALMLDVDKAHPDVAILLEIEAWDTDCSQNIPRKI